LLQAGADQTIVMSTNLGRLVCGSHIARGAFLKMRSAPPAQLLKRKHLTGKMGSGAGEQVIPIGATQ
jgi:hypothetical protein